MMVAACVRLIVTRMTTPGEVLRVRACKPIMTCYQVILGGGKYRYDKLSPTRHAARRLIACLTYAT